MRAAGAPPPALASRGAAGPLLRTLSLSLARWGATAGRGRARPRSADELPRGTGRAAALARAGDVARARPSLPPGPWRRRVGGRTRVRRRAGLRSLEPRVVLPAQAPCRRRIERARGPLNALSPPPARRLPPVCLEISQPFAPIYKQRAPRRAQVRRVPIAFTPRVSPMGSRVIGDFGSSRAAAATSNCGLPPAIFWPLSGRLAYLTFALVVLQIPPTALYTFYDLLSRSLSNTLPVISISALFSFYLFLTVFLVFYSFKSSGIKMYFN